MAAQSQYSIIFHGNCIDGWFAAYLANQTLRPANLYPVTPNQMHSWPTGIQLFGTHVLLVDVSAPKSYRDLWIAEGARSVDCIDHHQSAMEHWTDKVIDTSRCAAFQVHQRFYPGRPIPGWLHAIDRIDRWENVTYEDRCIREMLSIIAHMPPKGELYEAIIYTEKFIENMEVPLAVEWYLAEGKKLLDVKDLQLQQVLAHGVCITVAQDHLTAWNLPATWLGINMFILNNTNVSIDSTEAAHLVFQTKPDITVYINYRIKHIPGKKFPQYIYSGRVNATSSIDLTKDTALRGHAAAAGAMIIGNPAIRLPFVL